MTIKKGDVMRYTGTKRGHLKGRRVLIRAITCDKHGKSTDGCWVSPWREKGQRFSHLSHIVRIGDLEPIPAKEG